MTTAFQYLFNEAATDLLQKDAPPCSKGCEIKISAASISAGPFSAEAGRIFITDRVMNRVHHFNYVGFGVGGGAAVGLVSTEEIGVVTIQSNDIGKTISGMGVSLNANLSLPVIDGATGQFSSSGAPGSGYQIYTGGSAEGFAIGVSTLGTYTEYVGSYPLE